MNKEQLINAIAQKTTITKRDASQILDALSDTIMEAVAEGEKITKGGFWHFRAKGAERETGEKSQNGRTDDHFKKKFPHTRERSDRFRSKCVSKKDLRKI